MADPWPIVAGHIQPFSGSEEERVDTEPARAPNEFAIAALRLFVQDTFVAGNKIFEAANEAAMLALNSTEYESDGGVRPGDWCFRGDTERWLRCMKNRGEALDDWFEFQKFLNVTDDAQIKLSDLDTDGTMAANSSTKVPAQSAVVTYVAAYVAAQIAALVNSSPSTLDTLKELADALGDDPNFATTIATALGLKAPLASPALTGTPTAPTAAAGTNTAQIATTAFVAAALAALSGLIDSVIGNTRGAILYRGSSGWTKLDPNTAGYVLTDGGSGADPSWQSPSGGGGGGWDSDSSQNVSAVSSVIFAINSAYHIFELVTGDLVTSTASKIRIRFSSDGGSTYDSGNNYGWALGFAYPTSGSGGTGVASADGFYLRGDSNTTLAANGTWAFSLRLYAPGSAKFKTIGGTLCWMDNSIGIVSNHTGGVWKSTAAITHMKIEVTAGTMTGKLRLLGKAA